MGGKKKFNLDRSLTFLAILLSVGTLIVFIYQTRLIRKQQYASVMPYLEMGLENYGSSNVIYALENNGIGPAFIRDVRVRYEGKEYDTSPVQFIQDHLPQMHDSIAGTFVYSAVYPGQLIPSNGRVELIAVNDSLEPSYQIAHLFQVRKMQIIIDYASLYDEHWRIQSGSLSPQSLD